MKCHDLDLDFKIMSLETFVFDYLCLAEVLAQLPVINSEHP